MQYTNKQFRSILNGFGYKSQTPADGSAFPVSNDDSPLKDALTVEAVKKFQGEYKLLVDGIVGPKTLAKAEEVIKILQKELNVVVKAGLPNNQPFYGPQTTAAVKKFQANIKASQNGIASNPIRLELYKQFQNSGEERL